MTHPSAVRSRPVEVVTLGEAMVLLLAEGTEPIGVARRFDASVAGAESNVAVGLARLGHAVALWTCVGTDPFGDMVLRTLRGEGVDVGSARRVEGRATGTLLRDAPAGRPVTVVYHRTGSAGAALGPQDVDPSVIAGASLVHVTGITAVLSDTSHAAVTATVEAAREAGVPVVLDPNIRLRLADADQWRERLEPLVGAADVVLSGQDELDLLSGAASGQGDPQWFLRRGPATVVLKDGAAGAVETDGTGTWRVASFPVPVVDPVGAGDGFAAGWLSGWLRGLPPLRRLQEGAAVAACVVAARGDLAGLPDAAVRDALVDGAVDVRR